MSYRYLRERTHLLSDGTVTVFSPPRVRISPRDRGKDIPAWRGRVGLLTKGAAVGAECQRSPLSSPAFRQAVFGGIVYPLSERVPEDRHGPTPSMACVCGFWAFADPHDLPDSTRAGGVLTSLSPFAPPSTDSARTAVVGVVEIWGRVVVGTKGWRGEYARPDAIVQREKRVRRIEAEVADLYGIPLLSGWPDLSPLLGPVSATAPPPEGRSA